MKRLAALALASTAAMFLAPAASANIPTVSIATPAAGTVAGTVTLTVAASSDTDRVDYFLDGAPIAFDSTCCAWDEAWDTTTVPDGEHVLTAIASESDGEAGASAPVTITVDNAAGPVPAPAPSPSSPVPAPSTSPSTPAPAPSTSSTTPAPAPSTSSTTPAPAPSTSSTTPVPAPSSTSSSPPPPPATSSTPPPPVTSSSTPPPGGQFACIGAPPDAPKTTYPWPTTFVDAQAWWIPTRLGQTGNNFGHVHVGSCIPERESISEATIPVDVRVILHDNPGTLDYVGIVVKGTSYEKTVAKLSPNTPFVGATGETRTLWLHYDLPTSSFDASGLQEIRYRVFVNEPNTSDSMNSSINYQTTILNGKSKSDVSREPYLRFKGWYTGAGYCEASYRSDLTPLPDGPVSGVWSPSLRMVWHGEPTDRPVTHNAVRLDPDFHAVPPIEGKVLRDAVGPWEGTQQVDTTTLANGVHRLHMKADCDDPRATNSGVGVVSFDVQNPAA